MKEFTYNEIKQVIFNIFGEKNINDVVSYLKKQPNQKEEIEKVSKSVEFFVDVEVTKGEDDEEELSENLSEYYRQLLVLVLEKETGR